MSNLGSDVVCQVAVVVKNIEQAAQAYAKVFNQPVPEPRLTGPEAETHIRYKGQPTDARAKLAFFKFGNLSVELIEPVGGPSTWQEHLDTRGEGVHHIAFRVPDMEESLAHLNAQGIPAVQRGDFKGGSYAYCDSTKDLKVVLELLASNKK